jgi:hypothetical protein
LQRAIGNQAVQRLLRANAEARGVNSDTPAAVRSGHDFGQMPLNSGARKSIQPKAKINAPGDEYEQEADRVAEQVMRITDTPLVQRKCAGCEEVLQKSPGQTTQKSPTISIGLISNANQG